MMLKIFFYFHCRSLFTSCSIEETKVHRMISSSGNNTYHIHVLSKTLGLWEIEAICESIHVIVGLQWIHRSQLICISSSAYEVCKLKHLFFNNDILFFSYIYVCIFDYVIHGFIYIF